MINFFNNIFTKYPIKTKRSLEILPGFVSWSLIFFPVWGSFFIPWAVAYFILFFDVYWLWKSFSLTVTAFWGSRKIKQAEKINWQEIARPLENFEKTTHIAVIPTYGETYEKLQTTIQSIADQTFPTKQIYVVIAMEEREKEAKEKSEKLIKDFKHIFGDIFATFHPDIEGEVKGKSSNESFGGKIAYTKLVEKGLIDINFATISSVDADTVFDKQYFAYLTYNFLKDEKRYTKFWQSANVFYNNFWQVPIPVRIISFFGSLWRTALLVQKERLVSNSTYSLSFKLLYEIDFWDTDVIPEDYRIFFKAFFRKKGQIWMEPIFLKTSMDAPQSSSFMKTMQNKYQQERRWSWGASDDHLFIKWWLTVPGVPFFRKTTMLFNVLFDHFLWPVNWFIITIAANVMPLVNPVFSRTALGYSLPRLAGFILTMCLFSTLAMIIIDHKQRPSNQKTSKKRTLLFPLEFLLLPIVGFFLSALPALISHTQLMLGKRLEYKVTEKI
jgi:cellulose synthase/poly-beta-1,6-N-acetylglucosamine synthase-like glycosyltransferase